MSEIAPLTFEEYDKLGLKPFCEKLERFLMVEHDFVEGSLVISLNAPFGGGKTTFLSMWNSDLDKRREGGSAIPKAIIINAWESDYCGDFSHGWGHHFDDRWKQIYQNIETANIF
jgi:predicted KAP-like P-loop ATPase